MAKIKGQHNNPRVISSFSPSWCLRPPSTKTTSSSSSSSSSNNNKNNKKNNNMSQKIPNEPSSPRISCMGQIRLRRRSSSGSIDSSSSSSSTSSPSNVRGQFNLLLIKRVISSKVLFMEMDPPRPVEKKKVGNNSVSLWTRRQCNGGDGINLQLQTLEQGCA